jgi:hypothetical protein
VTTSFGNCVKLHEFQETLMSWDRATDPSDLYGKPIEIAPDRYQIECRWEERRTGEKGCRPGGGSKESYPEDITKKEVLWRVAHGQYDPLGLLCAFTIRFKIIMQSLSVEEDGANLGWDESIPLAVKVEFHQFLQHLKGLKKIGFHRSIWTDPSQGPVKGKPMLLLFGDSSVEASCALAYLRWELADRSVLCHFLAGKTRVAPKDAATYWC